jgi:polyhydroxyalkanoate synthesis regulator phasin
VPGQGRRGELRRRAIEDWKAYVEKRSRPDDAVFGVWFELTKLSEQGFAESAKALIDELVKRGGEGPANPRVVETLAKQPPKSIDEAARVYGDLLESIYAKHKHNAAEDPADEQLRLALYDGESPGVVTPDEVDRYRNRAERDHQRNLEKQIEQLMVTNPGAPPRAMVMRDSPRLFDPYVFERGSEGRRGPRVERRFLQVLAKEVGGEPFAKENSGRLELAQAIVHADNPLTMRVWVNRVWQHHFGVGLARGADDFGARSDPPMHDELLDYLTTRFRAEGLSTKRLHRMIMLSATYMQVSDDRPAGSAARRLDPENELVWRQHRHRLAFEPMRDAMLHAAGRLDASLEGRPVNIESQPFSTRRTVYAFIDRQQLPGVFRVFDFASPDACTPERPHTVAPQQALFMMNSPFTIEQVKHLTARAEVQQANTPAKRIEALYRLVLSRQPRADEIALGVGFTDAESAAGDGAGKLSVWEKYAQALMLSNEFMFVD